MNRAFLYHFMKSKYPLLEEKRLKNVINDLPEEFNMADRYISSKEFRKLNMVTELLTERFSRNSIRWYCEKDGWSLIIDRGTHFTCVTINQVDINTMGVMEILNQIISNF